MPRPSLLDHVELKLQELLADRQQNDPSAYVTPDDLHRIVSRRSDYRRQKGAMVAATGVGNVMRRQGWSLVGRVNSRRPEAHGRKIGAYRYTRPSFA
jgi:hypothetical protein